MKLLLDTHLLLWAAVNSDALPHAARELLENHENILFFSSASIWEVVIKSSLGRDDFKVNARLLRRGLLDNGYEEIGINSEHTIFLESLPMIHKDPFDRILIAQAMVEGCLLLTADALIAQYPGPIQLL